MTRTTKALALGGALLVTLAPAPPCRAAVTVSVSPAAVSAGQEAVVSARATFTIHPRELSLRCPLEISFGDGSPAATEACELTPCTLAVRHAYRAPGSFLVTASTRVCRTIDNVITTAPLTAEARVAVAPAALSVAADPAIVRVPRDRGLAAPVTWRATGAAAVDATLVSASGSFEAGGAVIATAGAPLTLRVAAGTGTAAETVQITPAVLRDAAARGARSVTFSRDFAGGGYAVRATMTALIVVPAAEFDLVRMELSFGNQRPEIVVGRGEQGLAARALLRFTGAGLLQARWEVDGRPVGPPVSRHVNPGDATELLSPALPTFDPGTHEVRLIVTSPPPPLPLPTILYLVRPGDAAPRPLAIGLLAPAAGETLPYEPALFRWEGGPGAAVFLVQFYGAEGNAPVFSAWTRASEYRLPELLYRELFLAGGRYRWKVGAYNGEENLAGESPLAPFGFARP